MYSTLYDPPSFITHYPLRPSNSHCTLQTSHHLRVSKTIIRLTIHILFLSTHYSQMFWMHFTKPYLRPSGNYKGSFLYNLRIYEVSYNIKRTNWNQRFHKRSSFLMFCTIMSVNKIIIEIQNNTITVIPLSIKITFSWYFHYQDFINYKKSYFSSYYIIYYIYYNYIIYILIASKFSTL